VTNEQVRSELKALFPALPIRLQGATIFLGDDERVDAIHAETVARCPADEIERLARIIRERLRSGWAVAAKPAGGCACA
jgi:hypothetical protein